MILGKDFTWHASHRLLNDESKCHNVHGHEYKMTVSVEGPVGSNGMVMNAHELKKVIGPLVDGWDHGSFVFADDKIFLEFLIADGSKHTVLPFETTTENLVSFVLSYIKERMIDRLRELGISKVTVRIDETKTMYAEDVMEIVASVE